MIIDMEPILLQTKLCVPPLRSSLIPRPELIDELNQGMPRQAYALLGTCRLWQDDAGRQLAAGSADGLAFAGPR